MHTETFIVAHFDLLMSLSELLWFFFFLSLYVVKNRTKTDFWEHLETGLHCAAAAFYELWIYIYFYSSFSDFLLWHFMAKKVSSSRSSWISSEAVWRSARPQINRNWIRLCWLPLFSAGFWSLFYLKKKKKEHCYTMRHSAAVITNTGPHGLRGPLNT